MRHRPAKDTSNEKEGQYLEEFRSSGVRSTPRASAREDLRRNFCAAANFKYQRGYRSRNSGVRSCRSCRIREQGLYPKIQDQHLPGKILAKLPDSLAPELLQLLTPEFRNVLGGHPKFQRSCRSSEGGGSIAFCGR